MCKTDIKRSDTKALGGITSGKPYIKGVESGIKNLFDEKIEQMIDNVKASLAIEGLYVTGDEAEIFKKYLEGALTEKEVLEIIKGRAIP